MTKTSQAIERIATSLGVHVPVEDPDGGLPDWYKKWEVCKYLGSHGISVAPWESRIPHEWVNRLLVAEMLEREPRALL